MSKATREAYGETLQQLVLEDPKIVVLDADLSGSTKTAMAKKVAPERHFNMGIAEENMIGVAAGIASSGYTVFASSFAMFATGRCWEQIRNSVVYPQLNVKICGSHGGISVGEDGVSHQATEDMAIMRSIPEMRVYCPADEFETKAIIKYIASDKLPCYVRLGRSAVDEVYDENTVFEVGKVRTINKGKKVAIFATGLMVQACMKALPVLKELGMAPTIVDVSCIKPIDEEGVVEILKQHEHIITAEEHNVVGGLGSAICEVACKYHPVQIERIGIQDTFAQSGNFKDLLVAYHLDDKAIIDAVKKYY